MKKIALVLALVMLFSLASLTVAGAASYQEYVVDASRGYCYLYSNASDRDGVSKNLGRYDNGEPVFVIRSNAGRDGSYSYHLVVTHDDKVGYMHDYELRSTSRWSEDADWYVVDVKIRSYCYLYSGPSDRDGVNKNMGDYKNGTLIQVLDKNGGRDGKYTYCYVRTPDGRYGYIHDYELTNIRDYDGRYDEDDTGVNTDTGNFVGDPNGNNRRTNSRWPIGDTCTIQTSSGRARSGPGTGYGITFYIHQGEDYEILDCQMGSTSKDWYKIRQDGQTGWISSGLVAIDGYLDGTANRNPIFE